MTTHRYIPASEKHGPKTACGIKLKRTSEGYKAWDDYAIATTGKAPTLRLPALPESFRNTT